jgi:tRNA-dihydrouridine synthase A
LSPKENRDIPPLDYDLVMRMKGLFPNLHISINGGITTLDQVKTFLESGLDGVMIGRTAYHDPASVLCAADREIFGNGETTTAENAVHAMVPYIDAHIASGGKLAQVTRHMLGLFTGRPGARMWRRTLSEGAHKPGADSVLVLQALGHITESEAQTRVI